MAVFITRNDRKGGGASGRFKCANMMLAEAACELALDNNASVPLTVMCSVDIEAALSLGRAQRGQREFLAAHPELQRRPVREQVYGSDGRTAKVSPLKRKHVATSDKASKERDERVSNDQPNELNRAAQRKHVKGSKEYEDKAASMCAKGSPYPAPSYLAVSEDEAEELVRRYAGKGTAKARRDGSWNGQEICVADRVVGYIVNKDGSEVPVRGFKIHYSKRGTHIVPFEAFEEMKDA